MERCLVAFAMLPDCTTAREDVEVAQFEATADLRFPVLECAHIDFAYLVRGIFRVYL